jgi:molecular chaperone GrpE
MDEDSIRNEEKDIEPSASLADDKAGRLDTPSSENNPSEVSEPPEQAASFDESQSSILSAPTGEQEPDAPEVPSESPLAEPAEEIQPPVPFEKFQEVLEAKEKLYDRFLRKQAEFENFRKRTEKEKQEFYEFALSNFIKELLPVLDGLERGLYGPESETVENYKKGMELILKQFRDVLSSVGLQPIRAIGTIFDPNYHQAVMREENNNLAENEIIEELQRGYTFRDRLLRPSMVKVAVPTVASTSDENPDQETVPDSQE